MLAATVILTVMGCSTQKNTSKSRWWHSFTAKYNTYYNGKLAYIDGSLEKEQGNTDNYTEIIPLYTVGNKNSRELGKSNFDRAIEKCEKAIKLHSIKRRPEWSKSRKKTPKDLEWLNRREYNPFLWKAWLLMGRSQFYEGNFDEAASTFAYMGRLYQTQPAIYGRARAWLAKCYIEQGWLYDAENVIREMKRDSIHWRAKKEWDYTYADYYIHTGEYKEAIPYLRNVIKHEMRRKQKARELFLLGQLLEETGDKRGAYKAFRHVVRLAPPYQLKFNAQIAMTEVLSAGQAKKMISRLKRMAANDNNSEYLDQVYYAIGNIYLANRDTAKAISAYETGNKKATRSGIEKGVLLLKLGDLYWTKEKFSDAQRCYGEAIGLLDKERPDYEQLSNRSKVLDELVPYTDAVYLQDSLQALAKMDEKSRNAAIDRVIDALKKKEKEEKRQAAEANAQTNGNTGFNNTNRNRTQTTANTTTGNKNAAWYFYNPLTVSQGKTQFQRQWGKRENVDNWQRINKTVVGGLNTTDTLTAEQRDSAEKAEAMADSLSQITDSAQNDPHKREYYMKQIPLTEEQVAASNAIIMDGLYNSGVIFKDKLDNLRLSEKAFTRLLTEYPSYEKMDDAYYHLFLLYSRKGDAATAQTYVDKLKANYPDSKWTALLTDPYFVENARIGVQMEDSLYGATYDAFKADRYGEVATNRQMSDTRFPLGANRDKFLFIGGLSKLNSGDAQGCIDDMKELVEKFPQSEVGEMAGMIINGVNAGKRLHGAKFDLTNVWDRRTAVLNDSDSINARKFSNERMTNFTYMIVYNPDSVKENQLLFQLAKFNFTNYIVRNFRIEIEDDNGLHRMKVAGFRSYDEALQYARDVYRQTGIVKLMGKGRAIIISDINLPLLGQQYSYDDYDKFYAKHFAKLKVSTFMLLTEPDEVVTQPEREEQPTETDVDNMLEDGTYLDNGLNVAPTNQGTDIATPTENNKPANQQGAQYDLNPGGGQQSQQGGNDIITIPDLPTKQEATGTDIVMPTNDKQTEENGDYVIEQNNQTKEQPVKQNTETEQEKVQPTETPVKQQSPENGQAKTRTDQKNADQSMTQPAKQSTEKDQTSKSDQKPATQNQQSTKQNTPVTMPTNQPQKEETETDNGDYVIDFGDEDYPVDQTDNKNTTPKKTEPEKTTPAKETPKKTEPEKKQEEQKKTSPKEKKDSYDLEDEYYELEGF